MLVQPVTKLYIRLTTLRWSNLKQVKAFCILQIINKPYWSVISDILLRPAVKKKKRSKFPVFVSISFSIRFEIARYQKQRLPCGKNGGKLILLFSL